jgi:uncharacterized RmlC-like cupin family protein
MAAEVLGAIVSRPGDAPISAVGRTLVVREWAETGPSYLHVHREDDEAWHVLEGRLRFRFGDDEVDATAGTTVFVPAGVPHTYSALEPSRYLIIMTPRMDQLIDQLHRLDGSGRLESTLGAFETTLAG